MFVMSSKLEHIYVWQRLLLSRSCDELHQRPKTDIKAIARQFRAEFVGYQRTPEPSLSAQIHYYTMLKQALEDWYHAKIQSHRSFWQRFTVWLGWCDTAEKTVSR